MKKLMLASLLALSLTSSAVAQDKEFDLKVTTADITLIGDGLGTLPYNKVAPLIQKLQQQIAVQQAKPPVSATPPETKKD